MHRIIHGYVAGAAGLVGRAWDRLFVSVRRPFGLLGSPIILPYRKFGTPHRVRLAGRVVEDRGVVAAAHTDSTAANLWLTFKRYVAYEVPGAVVAVRFAGEDHTVASDRKGFFEVEIEPTVPVRLPWGESWLSVELRLLQAGTEATPPLSAEAFVLIPSPTARFGIISDIDDTIVKTGATNFLKHWRTVVANSAEARVPFRGLAPFYRALHSGPSGGEANPIFYVSSSPWNLYDLFERFMILHDIPLGPILLRPIGVGAGHWPGGSHKANKLAQIDLILSTYPDLNFILVGDSGQRDAEIYALSADRHPGRVLAIYIRDVTDTERDLSVKAVLTPAAGTSVRIAYGSDLIEAAEDAAAAGWITTSALPEIRAAVANPDLPGA
jgi:phosphatidate phosphatase APP1